MFKYLTRETYYQLREVIEKGSPLPLAVANDVAKGMKQWAMEMGVTHCTHWFQPLTEGTAEKHDAFVEHDMKGGMVEDFRVRNSCSRNPMLHRSLMEVSVLRSKHVAIRRGILRRLCLL